MVVPREFGPTASAVRWAVQDPKCQNHRLFSTVCSSHRSLGYYMYCLHAPVRASAVRTAWANNCRSERVEKGPRKAQNGPTESSQSFGLERISRQIQTVLPDSQAKPPPRRSLVARRRSADQSLHQTTCAAPPSGRTPSTWPLSPSLRSPCCELNLFRHPM